jgi:UDP-N-acetylmuramyl pentapeptide phosphotransferase/UDP-N-acetylglucosamine-1-phosphate transferase
MENFIIIVASVTLVCIVILSRLLKSLDSKQIKDDDPKYKTNSPFNVFMGVLIIIIVIGTLLALLFSDAGNPFADPIHRP